MLLQPTGGYLALRDSIIQFIGASRVSKLSTGSLNATGDGTTPMEVDALIRAASAGDRDGPVSRIEGKGEEKGRIPCSQPQDKGKQERGHGKGKPSGLEGRCCHNCGREGHLMAQCPQPLRPRPARSVHFIDEEEHEPGYDDGDDQGWDLAEYEDETEEPAWPDQPPPGLLPQGPAAWARPASGVYSVLAVDSEAWLMTIRGPKSAGK